MEFWGVEVKSGEPLNVKPGDEEIVHISQACLGEVKKDKGSEAVRLYVKVGDQKLVLGTLSPEKFPQLSFDLVFEREFELSHNWKNGSVYFCGYRSALPFSSDDSDSQSSEEEEDLPIDSTKIGIPELEAKPAVGKPDAAKPGSAAAKPKVNFVEPNKENESDTDDGESDESDSSEDDSEEDQVMPNGEDESTDEDDNLEDDDDSASSSDEDEQTPKKAEVSQKRPAGSALKTPVPDKKAKLVTPQKNDGKKGDVHIATPHPSKKAGKVPATNIQAKKQTPSSSGSHSCKSCNRSFKDDRALQSHTKAKHGTAA